jgi:hydrogenase maturation factor
MMASVDPEPTAKGVALPEDLAEAARSLARRFAAGATMWCVSAQWPSHASHVAVEFVHPVIVGKRALPAVHVAGGDATTTLRMLARPGDVLLVVGTADDAVTTDLLRRAETWGLCRLWLGAGTRPRAGYAEHVVWAQGADPGWAARSGDVVLLYHLLWELTHVVFEHPGLLTPEEECTGAVCVTCADQGDIAEVGSVEGSCAEVLVRGHRATVDVSLVDPVSPGDLVLVHAGVAISSLGDGT